MPTTHRRLTAILNAFTWPDLFFCKNNMAALDDLQAAMDNLQHAMSELKSPKGQR